MTNISRRMHALRITPSFTPRADAILARYLADISRHPLLTTAEEERLTLRSAAGDADARQQLVRANLRFVVSVAKQYQHRGMPLMDLIAEGNIGLLKAAERFEPTRGFKFISYAAWWVRERILKALTDQSALVRLPRKQFRLAQRMEHLHHQHQVQHDAPMNLQAQAEALGVPLCRLQDLLHAPRFKATALFSEDGEANPIEAFSDPVAPPTDVSVEEASRNTLLQVHLARLGKLQGEVLRLHYGLCGGEALTLRAVGERVGLSAERVRQVRNEALTRLRERSALRHEHLTAA